MACVAHAAPRARSWRNTLRPAARVRRAAACRRYGSGNARRPGGSAGLATLFPGSRPRSFCLRRSCRSATGSRSAPANRRRRPPGRQGSQREPAPSPSRKRLRGSCGRPYRNPCRRRRSPRHRPSRARSSARRRWPSRRLRSRPSKPPRSAGTTADTSGSSRRPNRPSRSRAPPSQCW